MKRRSRTLGAEPLLPLELGVIKDTPEDRQYIAHFITHLIGLSDEDYDRVVAVIGALAEASHVDKTAIFDAVAGSVNAAMIISNPSLWPTPSTCWSTPSSSTSVRVRPTCAASMGPFGTR